MTTSVPTTRPPGKGWLPWINSYGIDRPEPYDYAEVETWREGWTVPHLGVPGDNPEMNAVGLYWRPAGPALTEQEKVRRALELLLRRT